MKSPLLQKTEIKSMIELLSAWIESRMLYRQQPGLSIGIVYDQELIWSRGFGYQDLESKTPATPQTLYRIASISKLFTSTGILQLRDQGLLRLDDPITEYLSWFKIKNRFSNTIPITLRHLLTHTSGLPRESGFPYWTDFQFPTREQLIKKLPEQEMAFPPGTQWKYSNLGLTLAGEILMKVSGEPYGEYIYRHILGPLEMTNTYVEITQDQLSRLATPYTRKMPDGTREKRPFTDSKGLTPAANLTSNVEDMARFASLQFQYDSGGDSQILKGSTLREMHRVHWLKPDWKSAYGLGFSVDRKGDRVWVGHGGNVAGYATKIIVSPEEKIGVIVMTNTDDGNPDAYVERTFQLVVPAIQKATAPPEKPVEPHPEWEKYTGKFRTPWGDEEIMLLNGELFLFDPTEDDPQASMLKLIPDGEHTFQIKGDAGIVSIGERAVFEFDPEGKISRVKIGENYTYPVGD